MSVIVVLILFSLIVAITFLILFIWATKSGQFEDSYTPSIRILFDDKKENNNNSLSTNEKEKS